MLKLVLAITRGILREQKTRRLVMAWIIGAAVLMVFFGSMVTTTWWKEHVWTALIYWAVCGWLTMTAVMLALLDVLTLQRARRQALRNLRTDILGVAENKDDDANPR